MSRNPKGINFFGPPLKKGVPLAKCVGLTDKINTLCDVLASLDGVNGVAVVRNGKQWAIVFNPSTIEAGEIGGGGGDGDDTINVLLALSELLYPQYVLGKRTTGTGESAVTTIGWVPTVSHASQHPETT